MGTCFLVHKLKHQAAQGFQPTSQYFYGGNFSLKKVCAILWEIIGDRILMRRFCPRWLRSRDRPGKCRSK
ncbi:MAG: hypothetical protein MUE44_14045, partial [Oscillatoriaceae cyanobacterium Prado104]|nr:hypothetical protein [Oscillatoriaceae cyanobacterium Prado104]